MLSFALAFTGKLDYAAKAIILICIHIFISIVAIEQNLPQHFSMAH
jgi:hypothetical protein